MNRYLGIVLGTAVALFGLSVLFGTWYTVDQGARGVIVRNGALVGVAQPGLGFKLPLIDAVETISVRTQVETFEDMHAYSRDGQPAALRLSVAYRVAPERAADLYALYGSLAGAVARVIRPQVDQHARVVFGGYTAASAIQEVGRLGAEIETAVRGAVRGPVEIESVRLGRLAFSKAFEQSVERRLLAEVEVERLRRDAERETVQAEIAATQAGARADAVRAEARAEADAIRLRGEAEAGAIRARGAALGDNPNLVALVRAERCDGAPAASGASGAASPSPDAAR